MSSLPENAHFFIGERVAICLAWGTWEWGQIVSYDSSSGTVVFWNVRRLSNFEIVRLAESAIRKVPGFTYINLKEMDCTCGVKYLRDGGIHSEWCPIFKKS